MADTVALEGWRDRVATFEAEVGRAVIGQARVIRLLTVAILARGHVLLEGDVGVGKTTLLRAVFPETMLHRIFVDSIYESRQAGLMRELGRQVFERVPVP